ncbi:MAG: hypothetical protein QOG33_765 [Gaiellales bacterium]|nr:hypothetical protein [Gaiellales bacterium]
MMYEEMLRPDPDQRSGRQLAKLYREHATAAFGYAHHLTGSREDAEDVVQLAFLEAHRVLERGDRIVNPRAWLVTAVKHRAHNLRRDRHETPDAEAIEGLADRPADGMNDASDELDRVRAVLYGLPEAQHHAFVLRHWSGMSNGDIASVLGCSESAVESLLVRARQAIVSDDTLSDACLDVRGRLSRGDGVGPFQHRHLEGCRSCRTAQQRLARIAGIAAAVALVPRLHVAQALAASAPGFSVATATGGAGAGAVAAGAGAKLGAAKTALAVLSVGAVAAGASVAHSHLSGAHHGRTGSLQPAPLQAAPVATVGEDGRPSAVSTAGGAGQLAGSDQTTSGERSGATASGDRSSTDGQSSGGDPSSGDVSSSGGVPTASGDQSSGGGSGSGDGTDSGGAVQAQDGSGSGGDTSSQPKVDGSGDQSGG